MRECARSGIDKVRISSHVFIMVFGIFALLAAIPIAAYAHPPNEVTLAYNVDTQTLEVTIEHKSPSPTWHHIHKVEIKKNDKSINTIDYTNQPDTPKFTYSYKVQATKGDVLEVTVTCNIYGSKTVKVTVDK